MFTSKTYIYDVYFVVMDPISTIKECTLCSATSLILIDAKACNPTISLDAIVNCSVCENCEKNVSDVRDFKQFDMLLTRLKDNTEIKSQAEYKQLRKAGGSL